MGGGKGGDSAITTRCGVWEFTLFVLAVLTGTACSICSKTMMELHGPGIDGDDEVFSKPLFQTFGMFVGMLFGLVMHEVVIWCEIPFPGYTHAPTALSSTEKETLMMDGKPSVYGSTMIDETKGLAETRTVSSSNNRAPVWMYFFLAIPSIFDLAATVLCMMGLRYLDVSVYQLLRGSGIIFVAIMKQFVLKDRLYTFQWLGVGWNVVAVVLVGLTAILASSKDESTEPGQALLGVSLVMLGAFVQSLQFVFEEQVMNMDESSVPPLLLIGMEGLWGTVLCLFVLYPLAYYLPGDDHGSFEDPFNTYAMFMNSPTIQWAFVIYFFAIFGYNLFAILVTFLLNSIWHAILDNFRPISVWLTDLVIYYFIISSGDFGEPWTPYSFIQLGGMFVLLYGTAIYNAPHAGSIELRGGWYALGINLEHEYDAVKVEIEEAEMHDEFEARKQNFGARRVSSMIERSPMISLHTQALRGLGHPTS